MRGENKFLRIIQVSVLLFSFFRPIRLQFGLKIRGRGGGGRAVPCPVPKIRLWIFRLKLIFIFSGPVQVSSGWFLKYYSSFSRFTDLNPSESGQNSSSLIVLFSTLKRSNYRISLSEAIQCSLPTSARSRDGSLLKGGRRSRPRPHSSSLAVLLKLVLAA